MRNLIRLYFTLYRKRDLILICTCLALAALMYLSNIHHPDIARYGVARLWLVVCVVYSATAFEAYFSLPLSYAGVLLPESLNRKFAFTLCRVLIVFPLVLLGLLMAGDALVNAVVSPRSLPFVQCLWYNISHTRMPLYHLPYLPYYAFATMSAVLLIRSATGRKQVFTILACCAIFLMIMHWGPRDVIGSTVYPFIIDGADVYIQGRGVSYAWSQPVSWTGLPMKAQISLSYLWLLAAPVAALAISYFNLKEGTAQK